MIKRCMEKFLSILLGTSLLLSMLPAALAGDGPVDLNAPEVWAQNAAFLDTDPAAGALGGAVTWQKAADESGITRYVVCLTDADGASLAELGSLAAGGGEPYSLPVPTGTPVPEGAVGVTILSGTDDALGTAGAVVPLTDTARMMATMETTAIYVSPSGDDSSGTGSESQPLATLSRAFANAAENATIYLRAGEYTGDPLAISGKANITVCGYPGETATVKYKFQLTNCTGITLQNFRIDAPTTALNVSGGNHNTVQNMDIVGRIYIYDTRWVTVANCLLHGNYDETAAVTLYYGRYSQIYNNIFNDNEDYGIYILESADQSAIYNNTFFASGSGDIMIRSSPKNVLIKNNLFTGGLDLASTDNATLNTWDHNLYDSALAENAALVGGAPTGFAELQALGNVEPSGLVGDPGFANAAGLDFRLTAGSAAVNGGAAVIGVSDGVTINAPAIDFYGNAREFPDIGAAEYRTTAVDTRLPRNVSFTDTDSGTGVIGGSVTWEAAADETEIVAYGVFYQLSDGGLVPIADVAKGGAYQYEIPGSTPIPAGAVKILVVAKTAAGYDETGTGTALHDTAVPTLLAKNVLLVDTDLARGALAGSVTWGKAESEENITFYDVCLTDAGGQTLASLGSAAADGSASYSLPITVSPIPAGAVCVTVFSRNDSGPSVSGTSFRFFDTSSADIYVAPNGSDANTGAPDSPLPYSYAAAVAPDGATVYLRGGVYGEPVTFLGKHNITLTAAPGEQPVVTAKTLFNNCSGVTVHGLTFQASDNKYVLQANASSDVTVSGLTVRGAVYMSSVTGYSISDCSVSGSAEEGGITLYGAKNGKVYNNTVFGNTKKGIYLLGSATSGNLIAYNSFYNNTTADLLINSIASYGTAASNTFRNNIFTKEFELGGEAAVTGNDFDYNLYAMPSATAAQIAGTAKTFADIQALGAEAHGLTGSAGYYSADTGDFRLTSESGAIGAGVALPSIPTDRTGTSRGDPPDLGAYCYDAQIGNTLQVLSKTPTGVNEYPDVSVSAVCSEPLDAVSNQEADFLTVSSPDGAVAGTVVIQGASAVFTPFSEFLYGVTYTATLKAGTKAANGKLLAGDVVWTFRIRDAGATGRDYYVSPDGKDDNPGTIEAPMRDITAVSALLQPGDRMILRAGTYDGYLLVWGKGTPDSDPIIVKNYDGEQVRIVNTVAANRGYILYVGASYNVRISGLIATNDGAAVDGVQTQNYGMYIHQSKNVTVDHCTFYEGNGGMLIRNDSENVHIYSNTFHDQDWRYGGITLYDGVKNSEFYNNLFYNDYYGVLFYGGTVTGNSFYNNTFYNTGADQTDLCFDTNNSALIQNNVFENNIFSSPFSDYGDQLPHNTFDHNLYNSDTMADGNVALGQTFASWQALGNDPNGVFGSASFVSPEARDFSPASGSAAVGIADDRFGLAVDFNAAARGGANTAGAFNALTGSKLYVSPTGSDSAAGTASAPFRTLSRAVAAAQSGDAILLADGTYAEDLSILDRDGLTVRPSGSGTVTLTGSIRVEGSGQVTLEGLTWSPADAKTFTVTGSPAPALRRLTLNGHVGLTGSDGFTVDRCLFRGGQDQLTLGAVSGGSVTNAQFYNAAGSALRLEAGCAGILVVNNTFYSADDAAKDIVVTDSDLSGSRFKNNIFSSGLQLCDAANLSGNVWNYNLYSSALSTPAVVGSTPYTLTDLQSASAEANGLSGDARFADATTGNLRITYYSDCRGKGTSIDAPAADFDGVSRSRPVDIGAFAYSGIAKTYYVAVSGDDANPGTSGAPFRTISRALGLARPMETVVIGGGVYHESLSLAGSAGTASGFLSIRAADGANVTVDGQNALETGFALSDSSYVRLESLRFTGFTGQGIALTDTSGIALSSISVNGAETALRLRRAASTDITGLTVTGGGTNGILIDGGSAASVARARVEGRSGSAVAAAGTDGLTVRASILTGGGTGLELTGSPNARIYNNTFYGNTGCDLSADAGSAALTAKNNIFGSEDASASVRLLTSGAALDYNHYARAEAAVDDGSSVRALSAVRESGLEAHATGGDPLFYGAESGDFDLRRGSPCIGSGVSDENTPTVDFGGSAFLAPVDRGARFSPLSYRTLYVAPDGSDSNDGSLEHPFKTVNKGMQSLKPSDTLYIRAGSYSERVNIDYKRGVVFRGETLGYTVESYPGETATFDSNDTLGVGIKFTNSSYWTLKNLHFTRYTGAAVWAAENSSYITMDSLRIWDISDPAFIQSGVEGILGDGGTYCTVRNCEIFDIGQERMSMADHAIYVGYSGHHWIIDANRLSHSPGGAIQLYGAPSYGSDSVVTNNVISDSMMGISLMGTKRTLVSNNTLVNNWYNDVYIDYSTQDCTIQNNIFYNDLPQDYTVRVEDREHQTTKESGIRPAVIGIYSPECYGNVIRANLYFCKNFTAAVRCLTEEGINGRFIDFNVYPTLFHDNTFQKNIQANPAFISSSDFHLQTGSPAIGSGVADRMPSVDFEGAARVAADLGAYAFRSSGGNPPDDGPSGGGSTGGGTTGGGSTGGGSTGGGASAAAKFTDIAGHWAESEIRKAVERGLFLGVSETEFDPDGEMTRGMAVTVLGRMAGIDPALYADGGFGDVDSRQYYAPFAAWAKSAGIANGDNSSAFHPDDSVTREQFAKMVAKYAAYAGLLPDGLTAEGQTPFADDAEISDWAKEGVYLLRAAGILDGKPGNRFDPGAPITRAEAAKILNALLS